MKLLLAAALAIAAPPTMVSAKPWSRQGWNHNTAVSTVDNRNCPDLGFDFGYKEGSGCTPGDYLIGSLEFIFKDENHQTTYDDSTCSAYKAHIGAESLQVTCFKKDGAKWSGFGPCFDCPFALIEHEDVPYQGIAKVKSGSGQDIIVHQVIDDQVSTVYETLGVIGTCDIDKLIADGDIRGDHNWTAGNAFSTEWKAAGQTCQGISHLEFCYNCGEIPDTKDGGSFGDPHVMTWSGDYFDYMGQCDLVLVDAPGFADGAGFTAHIRTKVVTDYSFIEAAAIKIGDDIFEVGSYGDYFFNGVNGAELTDAMIGGFPIEYEEKSKKEHFFRVRLGESGTLVMKSYQEIVSIRFNRVVGEDFGDAVGLMGDFYQGARLSRDGARVIEDIDEFGEEWQVLSTEPQLFDSPPPLEGKCVLPTAPSFALRRRLVDSISLSEAEAACARLPVGQGREQCVYDVIATGDFEMAEAGAF